MDRDSTLRLATLADHSSHIVDTTASRPLFSADSSRLYFWRGSPDSSRSPELWRYDIASGISTEILDADMIAEAAGVSKDLPDAELKQLLSARLGGPYSVSPSEEAIAIWSGWLWVIASCQAP